MILITGGSGFLGQRLAALLADARALSSADLDLTDGDAVFEAMMDWQPDVVIHLAARVGGITANIASQGDFLIDNLRMDANLLAAVRVQQPSHLVTMLSTCMYPDELDANLYPMTEGMIELGPPPPTNAAYAAAKRALWHGTRALHDQYGTGFTALVPANLYGPGDHFGSKSSHFLAAAIDKIETARRSDRPSVDFFGTGRALRQYVFVDDLARLVALLAERHPVNDTLNVAPRLNLSIRHLAEEVARVAGYDGKIGFTGDGPDGQIRKDVSSERLRKVLPEWNDIETDLPDGIGTTIDWYRTHVETG